MSHFPAPKLIPHSRPVTEEDKKVYGDYATNDLEVQVLLAYEFGKLPDMNGNQLDSSIENLNKIKDNTNNAISQKLKNPITKLFDRFKNVNEDNATIIPIIKNHDSNNVDLKVGYIKGQVKSETLVVPEEFDQKTGDKIAESKSIYYLFSTAIIQDPETMKKIINQDLSRETSVGLRGDYSLRELSLVTTAAFPLAGFLMGEFSGKKNINTINMVDGNNQKPEELAFAEAQRQRELKFAEVRNMESQRDNLANKIIPNHILLCKAIKTGRIMPYQYDDYINEPTEMINKFIMTQKPQELMSYMFGTSREAESFDDSTLKELQIKLFEQSLLKTSKYDEQSGKRAESFEFSAVKGAPQEFNFSEKSRKDLLERILDLQKVSPKAAEAYLMSELETDKQDPKRVDLHLQEYQNQLINLNQEIEQSYFLLGENTNG